MHKFLQDTPVRITCQACGKVLEKKMKWVKKNKVLKCKKCGKKIDLTKQEVRKAVKDIRQAMDNFEQALARLHKASVKTTSKRKPAARRVSRPALPEAQSLAPAAVKEKRSFV
jgi:DNA-directed RNA polymerase subunit M/transcription elongation factor TFIIS